MKTELAKQLLKNIIEPLYRYDEDSAEEIFKELQFFAEYKYDHYEMYAPGRHFLEHLYIWLKQFEESDRAVALDFVRKDLIYYTRSEFELLARILYWNIVRNIQLDIVSEITSIPRYKITKLANHDEFKHIERSSLYIGMSDGARIDYFRRQNQSISNEQVLTSYHVDQSKCSEMIKKLEEVHGPGSRFRTMFLIDDFCASGSTLIRENDEKEMKGTLRQLEKKVFPQKKLSGEIEEFIEPTLLSTLLSEDCKVYLCPLLATKKSVDHIESLTPKLDSLLNGLKVEPVTILDEELHLDDPGSAIGEFCEKYYQERMGDEHTKNVTYGYKNCGLPLVLHHNTPNNSLYILWNRRAADNDGDSPSFEPLFKRIERHKSSREE